MASPRARWPTVLELDQHGGYPTMCGIVKKPFGARPGRPLAEVGHPAGEDGPGRRRGGAEPSDVRPAERSFQALRLPVTNQIRCP
jgi:hypothetical protein